MEEPVRRAADLRQGVRHGEHAPVQPRLHLTPASSNSQAEAFLTWRPWFQLKIEKYERFECGYRFDRHEERHLKPVPSTVGAWKARGNWQDSWGKGGRRDIVGWKWRHESPSPEPKPEDLAHVQTMANLELTPSEVDALEGIPELPPTPPRVHIDGPEDQRRDGVFSRKLPAIIPERQPKGELEEDPEEDLFPPSPSTPAEPRPTRARPRRAPLADPQAPQTRSQRVTIESTM